MRRPLVCIFILKKKQEKEAKDIACFLQYERKQHKPSQTT